MNFFLFSLLLTLIKSAEDINCDISKGPVVIESTNLKCNGQTSGQTIEYDQRVVIQGSSTTNYIDVKNSNSLLYFRNLNIDYESAVSISGGNVKIYFEGSNTIKSGDNAGIKCYNSAKLTFSNGTQDDNSQNCILKVSSGTYTGIGVDYEVSNCSELNFLGGHIEATGGIWGAGIGTGLGSDAYGGNVDSINIVSGYVKAVGGRYAAGIGCGRGQAPHSSNVGTIKIYGGTVSGQSLEYGAGIGAGFGNGDQSASVGKIYIYGGEVNGNGGKYGSGVGGGYGFGTESASVSEISLVGKSEVEHTSPSFVVCNSVVGNGGDSAQSGVGNGKDGKVLKINTQQSNLNCNNKYCDFKAESGCARPWKCSSSSQNDCPKCAEHYILVSGQCVAKNDGGDGCTSATSEGVCLACRPGYQLSGGKCYTCPAGDHCAEYKEGCQCARCDSDEYLLVNGQCALKGGDGGEGCTSATPMGVCTECQPGYQLSDGKCYTCPTGDHCSEYKEGCQCAKCENPYFLNEGRCSLCNLQFCEQIRESDCTCLQCRNGYVLESPYICRSCGVSHCSSFVNGCECATCENGYTLSDGKCLACDVPHCETFSQNPNSCACTLCATGYKLFNSVCKKVLDQYSEIPSFAYCPNADDFRCTQYTNEWSYRKEGIVAKAVEVANAPGDSYLTAHRSKGLAYRMVIDDIRNSHQPENAFQDINSKIKNLNTDKGKVIIYQFGSMTNDAYDFSGLKKEIDVVIICMDEIIYGSGSAISVKSGKMKKLRSLTCYFGDVRINGGTLKLNNLALIAAPVYSSSSVECDYLLTDCYGLSGVSKLSPKVDNLAVFFPERNPWTFMTFNNNRQVVVQPGNYPSIAVPTNIAKKQTSIISYSTDIVLNSDSVKKFKDSVNISVHSNGEPVKVDFSGSQWKNTKLSEGIIIEADDKDKITVQGKPKSGKIKAYERYDDTQVYKKKGLSRGAIAGIVVVVLLLVAVAVFLAVYFLCVKNRNDNDQDEKSMRTTNTNDLFKPIFQDEK